MGKPVETSARAVSNKWLLLLLVGSCIWSQRVKQYTCLEQPKNRDAPEKRGIQEDTAETTEVPPAVGVRKEGTIDCEVFNWHMEQALQTNVVVLMT
jgi:hypothetical protein